MKRRNIFSRVFFFYVDGFRNLSDWGKKLWIIIFLKGILIFVLMKFLFFPNILNKNYDTDEERSNHVIETLTKSR
ncbi:MAG: DUF4492 domain-containing protein [Marinilabiliales bacterium]|nr:MAG: DUF4492 domain-containing protein [Marinilabiliales bacterium]